MSLNAVIFDLDDTLVVDEAVSKEALHDVALLASKQHGIDAELFLAAAKTHAEKLWVGNPAVDYCGRIGISFEEALYGKLNDAPPAENQSFAVWASTARVEFFDALLRAQGVLAEEAADELAAAFVTARRRLQRLIPNALETLLRLKQTYRIGLLTNGASSIQREKIADSGLAPAFDAIVVSGEENVGKPTSEIFEIAAERLGTRVNECAMVGNSLHRDILGARQAGFALAIWLNVPGSEEPAYVVPDATIFGLHELPDLLARLSSR